MRAFDESGNVAEISNVALLDLFITPPGRISNFIFNLYIENRVYHICHIISTVQRV